VLDEGEIVVSYQTTCEIDIIIYIDIETKIAFNEARGAGTLRAGTGNRYVVL
jgi:hypothetical protein